MSTVPDPATTDWVPLWSMGQPGPPALAVLFDETLLSSRSSLDIQNIPQDYAHLRLIYSLRSDRAATTDYALMKLNNLASAGYHRQYATMVGTGAWATGQQLSEAQIGVGDSPAASASAGYYGLGIIDIANYTGGTTKVLHYRDAWWDGTNFNNRIGSAWAQIAAAINRLTLAPGLGTNFVAGSRITLYGLGYTAPVAPGAIIPPTYGTSLPGSPLDGQEAILVDSVTAPTYQWRFRYNAGSASAYKWEFVGGPPASARVAAEQTTTSTTYADLTTAGPSFTLPRAGDYEVEWGCLAYVSAGSGLVAPNVGLHLGGAYQSQDVILLGRDATGLIVTTASISYRLLGVAASAVSLKYKVAPAGTAAFKERYLKITPVRVS